MVEVDDLEVAGLHDACSCRELELLGVVLVVCDVKSVERDVLFGRIVNLGPSSVVPGVVDVLVDVANHYLVEDEF